MWNIQAFVLKLRKAYFSLFLNLLKLNLQIFKLSDIAILFIASKVGMQKQYIIIEKIYKIVY
jgi:hypothetical protein